MNGYTDAGTIIASHPHRVFEKVVGQGYTIVYLVNDWVRHSREFLVVARLKDEEVAKARFTASEYDPYLSPQHITVREGHRRKGVGSAIYVLAELLADRVLANVWGIDPAQSEEARALWAQPDRTFGKHPKWWAKS